MAVARYIGGRHADLAVRDLAGGTRVLPRHAARCLALLEESGFIDNQDCVVVREMLHDLPAHHVAQRISVPPIAP